MNDKFDQLLKAYFTAILRDGYTDRLKDEIEQLGKHLIATLYEDCFQKTKYFIQ